MRSVGGRDNGTVIGTLGIGIAIDLVLSLAESPVLGRRRARIYGSFFCLGI